MVLELIEQADGLIEGFRPGVMERLGLGPGPLARNPRLVRARDRMGAGRPAVAGGRARPELHFGHRRAACNGPRRQPPTPPLNVLGDYAGGSLYPSGFRGHPRSARLRARPGGGCRDGRRCGVDHDGDDGPACGRHARQGARTNLLDTGAPFYEVYACADGKYVSVGPIEGKFYRLLLEQLGLQDHPQLQAQMDRAQWPAAKQILAAKFRERTRDEWALLLSPLDVCVAPVLDFDEAPNHPHVKRAARSSNWTASRIRRPAHAFAHARAAPRCADHRQRDRRAARLPDARIEALRAQQTFI